MRRNVFGNGFFMIGFLLTIEVFAYDWSFFAYSGKHFNGQQENKHNCKQTNSNLKQKHVFLFLFVVGGLGDFLASLPT